VAQTPVRRRYCPTCKEIVGAKAPTTLFDMGRCVQCGRSLRTWHQFSKRARLAWEEDRARRKRESAEDG
jgi:hypothetical protein